MKQKILFLCTGAVCPRGAWALRVGSPEAIVPPLRASPPSDSLSFPVQE
jgi:hypothetical protein